MLEGVECGGLREAAEGVSGRESSGSGLALDRWECPSFYRLPRFQHLPAFPPLPYAPPVVAPTNAVEWVEGCCRRPLTFLLVR